MGRHLICVHFTSGEKVSSGHRNSNSIQTCYSSTEKLSLTFSYQADLTRSQLSRHFLHEQQERIIRFSFYFYFVFR